MAESNDGGAKKASVERWTIDRVDIEARIARVEIVPIREDQASTDFVNRISEKGVSADMDQISIWDIDRVKTKYLSFRSLANRGIGTGDGVDLSENMVFWILPAGARMPARAFQATQAARQISK